MSGEQNRSRGRRTNADGRVRGQGRRMPPLQTLRTLPVMEPFMRGGLRRSLVDARRAASSSANTPNDSGVSAALCCHLGRRRTPRPIFNSLRGSLTCKHTHARRSSSTAIVEAVIWITPALFFTAPILVSMPCEVGVAVSAPSSRLRPLLVASTCWI